MPFLLICRYALENASRETDEEEEEQVTPTTRTVLLRERSVTLSQYLLRILQSAPAYQLSLSQFIQHTGFPIKRLTKMLAGMEKEGLIQSQLMNQKRSFIKVFKLASIPVTGEPTVIEKQGSDQAMIRRNKIIDIVFFLDVFDGSAQRRESPL